MPPTKPTGAYEKTPVKSPKVGEEGKKFNRGIESKGQKRSPCLVEHLETRHTASSISSALFPTCERNIYIYTYI